VAEYNLHQILKRPVLSEKAYAGSESGRYSFYVDPRVNKTQVKEAVETLFKVQVVWVNIQNVHGKPKRMGRSEGKRPDRKKAIVQLAPGQKIEALQGLT
jgi:large subunit ribosomal protein L23